MTPELAQPPKFPQFSFEFLDFHGILPLEQREGSICVATSKTDVDPYLVDELTLLFSVAPEFKVFDANEISAAIARTYRPHAPSAQEVLHEIATSSSSQEAVSIDDLRAQANDAPVIRLVNALLREALEARASDVHLETGTHALSVRYRIDGVMQPAAAPPANVSAAVISRLKIMADLDIAERRLPQDGRIRLRLDAREVDVRVSTLPGLHGESIVLRLLDARRGTIGLDEIGLPADLLAHIESFISKPHGMLLVTGPTGSGKTTTLYAVLNALRDGSRKIITVEDPVEYELPLVTQVQINARFGLTFPTVLRSVLRQDPDIILVGEIRDSETASIAAHAALTGHLVLATLHTSSAAAAVTRLMDLGLPSYLLSSTLDAVLAQRLVRRLCASCCELREDEPQAVGCAACRFTGFHGRTGAFELLRVTESIRHVIAGSTETRHVEDAAVQSGMRTLLEDGLRLVSDHVTTRSELLRAIQV